VQVLTCCRLGQHASRPAQPAPLQPVQQVREILDMDEEERACLMDVLMVASRLAGVHALVALVQDEICGLIESSQNALCSQAEQTQQQAAARPEAAAAILRSAKGCGSSPL
jgi:hypothetical protein